MDRFEPVTLGWGEHTWEVPPDRVLRLVARVEDALVEDSDQTALALLTRPQGPGLARLARAYGVALRYAAAQAGAKRGDVPTDDEIYLSIEGKMGEGRGVEAMSAIQSHVLALFAIIAPQTYQAATGKAEAAEKKTKPSD